MSIRFIATVFFCALNSFAFGQAGPAQEKEIILLQCTYRESCQTIGSVGFVKCEGHDRSGSTKISSDKGKRIVQEVGWGRPGSLVETASEYKWTWSQTITLRWYHYQADLYGAVNSRTGSYTHNFVVSISRDNASGQTNTSRTGQCVKG